MDELLEQFLIESRDLAEHATEDLLVLETAPDDKARFDNAFRAFHTLKGGAGIVGFDAMGAAVHAAENLLSAARSGSLVLTPAAIGDCLLCLDQVMRWLGVIESTGALPRGAAAEAAAIVARFAASTDATLPPAPAGEAATDGSWARALRDAHPAAARRATTAVRYRPDVDAFFRHVDPVASIAALPGLLALDIVPREPWLPLAELDPFSCNLVIAALSEASSAEIVATLGEEAGRCDIESLTPAAAGPGALPSPASEILEEQLLLLAETGGKHAAGRRASATAVAINVLRAVGRDEAAERVANAAANDARLRAEIEAALGRSVPPPEATPDAAVETRTLRVEAARIDALVRLTGEITVAKNAIGHTVKLAEAQDSTLAVALKTRHAALNRLVGELQRSVLGLRVLPLRVAFRRYPRLVRDMAAEQRKPATLVVEGDETEADKAIVEMLVEPLLHVLRNAMDHGIEDAGTRAAAGKPPVATIRLRASRQGEHVVLEVSDDGRGIDVAKVRKAARERGVATDDALEAMSDMEAMELIFAPGLSTAAAVTAVSGRGVGMDAVRSAVRRLAGHVSVDSVPGRGTTVRLTLPFTAMIADVMTVEAGGQAFGIPLDAIVETIKVPAGSLFAVGASHAIVLRDRTVPVLDLAGLLGAAAPSPNDTEVSLVVTQLGGERSAIRVDRVGERIEVMLEPLAGLLEGMPGIAGSTLLGDGSVLLVLDLAELLS